VKQIPWYSILLLLAVLAIITLPKFYAKEDFQVQSPKNSGETQIKLFCDEYEKDTFIPQLNNRIDDYIEISSKQGIEPQDFESNFQKLIREKQLVEVSNSTSFILDTFYYSFPFLTPRSLDFLEEVSELFQNALVNSPLEGTRLVVTSLTRTTETVKKLVRVNRAASSRSSHMNGNSFDISLKKFDFHRPLSDCEQTFLRETLGEVLLHQKEKEKCWVTFERFQQCLHVVVNHPKNEINHLHNWKKF